MPSAFLGFFSKRENARALRKSSEPSLHSRPKSPAGLPHASTSSNTLPSPTVADASELLEGSELSLETEYVLADADSPTLSTSCTYPPASSSSNAAGPSTSRLKMPFRRKQSTPTKLTAAIPQNPVSPTLLPKEPHKFSIESSVSSLLPPPSRSAIFGSYADPHNALSTRSLPQDVPLIHSRQYSLDMSQDYDTMSNPDSHGVPESKQPSKGGIFSWARPRGRTKSKASIPGPSLRSAPVLPLPSTDSSFNLRSFRSVTFPSPESTPPSSTPPNKSPIPRPNHPREDSFTSDASQRISVAAFREAQSRRSTADSPVPSSSGDRDSFASGQIRNRKISSSFGTPPSGSAPAPQPRRPMSRSPPTRSSTAPLSFATSMTTSDSSEEEESESEGDDEEEATVRPRRKRTVTSRSAHSELGHRSPPKSSVSASRSDIGHGLSSGLTSRPSPILRVARNSPGLEASGKGSRTSGVYSHARASVSTSALGSDATANRASVATKHSAAPRPTQPPQRSRSRASTSSDESSSSYSSDSEDAPLSSLIPPQRPGSAMSRASGSPARRPAKPLIDIGQLVGENAALPPRTSEPPSDPPSHPAPQTDSSPARLRKTSLGLGERFSALTSGFSGLQPSRSKSPEEPDAKDEAFTPPDVPEKPHPSRSQSPIRSPPLPSPISPAKPAPPAPRSKASKSSLALRLKSSATPRLNTSSLNLDSAMSPPPSSSTSSDAPIPHITPTPIRAREQLPAFAVTSRPTSHASNLSIGTLPTVEKPIAAADYKAPPRGAVPGAADKPKQDQQQRRPPQEESQSTTVRVVRSVVPLKSSGEDPLPIPRPRSRPHLPSVGVTVSNVHLTPPSSSASNSSSALREFPSSGVVVPPRRPFALRESSPASSAGDSSSSRMPVTPRDGSDLGVSSTGRPGVSHRKRASVTFVDELEDERSAREKERNSRKISGSNRSSHGLGHGVASDSSDDEDTARDRERKAEEKRKERRRTEAKAAIELGNVINGPGPIDDDDDEDDEQQPMNVPPRMSMAMGMGMNPGHNVPFPSALGPMGLQGQWGPSAAAPFGDQFANLSMQNFLNAGAGPGLAGGMSAGMNMGAGMVDPRVLAVHHHAMMIAKQTYQLAVAQQAMRDAGEEWERGSTISGWNDGRSSVGGSSMLGMGMGMNSNMNMNMGGGGGGGGMGGFPGLPGSFAAPGPNGMWPGGAAMPGFPGNSGRSPMYTNNFYAASEIGGGGDRGGSAGWTTSSVYGEAFGAPRDRNSRAFRRSQMMQTSGGNGDGSGGGAAGPASGNSKRDGGRPRTRTAPSGLSLSANAGTGTGTVATPRAGGGGVGVKKQGYGLVGAVTPPSSWKGPL